MTGPLIAETVAYQPVIIFGFIVVFLLLFLLYREKYHSQPRQHITVNIAPTINNQTVPKQTSVKSETPASDEEDKEKSKDSLKVVEHGSCDDASTRKGLRHRRGLVPDSELEEPEPRITQTTQNSSESGHEQVDQRVFSRPSLAGTSTVAEPLDNKKAFQDDLPSEEVKTNPKEFKTSIRQERSKKASEEKLRKPKTPTFKSDSSTDSFTFEVDKRGCNVNTRYCLLSVPPDSVLEADRITMTPVYIKKPHSHHQVCITPYVVFKSLSGKEPVFTNDVMLSLYSDYSAADDKQQIPVKILWSKDSESPLKCVGETLLGRGKFVSFTCRHFCGYCLAVEESHFHSMKRHYYYAGYVRKSFASTRIFHWLIFQDCPALHDRIVDYLKDDDKECVMDPESFDVDYDYTLQMILKRHDICPGDHNREDVKLSQFWGSRVNQSFQFEMNKICEQTNANLKVLYSMFALHNRTPVHREICNDKRFYYEWKDPPPGSPRRRVPQTMNVNVHGNNATGVQINYPSTEQQVQHQESVESNTSGVSSGYGSPLPTEAGRTFSMSDRDEQGRPAFRQDSGFNDQEEAKATTPKFAGKPEQHSTPRVARTSPVMQERNVVPEPKFFSSPMSPLPADNETQTLDTTEDSSLDAVLSESSSTPGTSQRSPQSSLEPQDTECPVHGTTEEEDISRFQSVNDSGVGTFNESLQLSRESGSESSHDIAADVGSISLSTDNGRDQLVDFPTSDSPPKSLENGPEEEC